MSHYEVLGVARGAPVAGIRRAYLKLAREHHPDQHAAAGPERRDEAERTMQRINEAWLVLGDRHRRADYDRLLAAEAPVAGDWVPGTAHPDFVPVDPDDDGEPELEPEDGAGTGRPVPAWQQLLPVASLAAALASFAVAAVLGERALVVVGLFLLMGAGVGFVLTPMLAVMRTYERDPGR